MRARSQRRCNVPSPYPLPQAGEGIAFLALDLENMAADTVAIALPTSVVDAKRRNARDARADGLFRWVVAAAGMLVLLDADGRGALDALGRARSVPDLRLQLSLVDRLGCGQPQVRRARADLRHAGHRADRDADRGAGQLRHRALPHRSRAELDARAGRCRDRAPGRHSVDHLRHVGPFRVRADHGRIRQSVAQRSHRRAGRSSARSSADRRSASACSPPASCSRSW